jgi:hypothetical protein
VPGDITVAIINETVMYMIMGLEGAGPQVERNGSCGPVYTSESAPHIEMKKF